MTTTTTKIVDTFLLNINPVQTSFASVSTDSPRKTILRSTSEGGEVEIYSMEQQSIVVADMKSRTFRALVPHKGYMTTIKDQTTIFDWTISDEQSFIMGYQCRKASLHHCNLDITAWFSTDIPLSAGPLYYGNLPGLILRVELLLKTNPDYKVTYTAIKIEEGSQKNQTLVDKVSSKKSISLSEMCESY